MHAVPSVVRAETIDAEVAVERRQCGALTWRSAVGTPSRVRKADTQETKTVLMRAVPR